MQGEGITYNPLPSPSNKDSRCRTVLKVIECRLPSKACMSFKACRRDQGETRPNSFYRFESPKTSAELLKDLGKRVLEFGHTRGLCCMGIRKDSVNGVRRSELYLVCPWLFGRWGVLYQQCTWRDQLRLPQLAERYLPEPWRNPDFSLVSFPKLCHADVSRRTNLVLSPPSSCCSGVIPEANSMNGGTHFDEQRFCHARSMVATVQRHE